MPDNSTPTLNAHVGLPRDGDGMPDYDAEAVVILYFGDTPIAQMPKIRESRAGHGDDSSYHASEEREIVEETVAAFLKERRGITG